ncbi:MAG: MerR family transcriptional regulator [Steroidobacteraceae bacterium]
MNRPEDSPLLSAAECAARTGLSTRALRLYEEHGLISPGRSPGGWRQYGTAELVRLNSIVLLKAAGLSLAQIATLLGTEEWQPLLPDLLALQLESWKNRKSDAERGQRIVEAALERLRLDRALTIDDLCILIRSLEMMQPAEQPSQTSEADPQLDESLLRRYAGFYRAGDWNVITIRCESKRLLMDRPIPPALELRPTSECDFEAVGPDLHVTFDAATDGPVTGLRVRMKGGDMAAPRIDAAMAEQVKSRLAERIKEGKALPGSESAVRRLVESVVNGQPHYEEMHPALAYAARWQLPSMRAKLALLGAIQSITFQGVGSAGWDVYDVQHEHGHSRFRIMLRSDGLITGALFMVKDAPASEGP